MRWLAWLAIVGLAGCTAPNPAYRAQADESGPESTSSSSTGLAETTDTSTGELATCEVHTPLPLAIRVLEGGVPRAPECTADGGTVTWIAEGNNVFPPPKNRIEHRVCTPATCPCLGDPPTITVELGDVAFSEDLGLPDCGQLALWTRLGPDGCEWAGAVLYDGDNALPEYIASNTLYVPPLVLIGPEPLTLGLAEDDPCAELELCNDIAFPGRYALDILGQATVTAEQPPAYIDVAFVMGGTSETYLFDNRMSSITRACELQVAWTAQRRPPP